MITIQMAGLTIGIDNRYLSPRRFTAYETDAAPQFTVSVTEAELDAEAEIEIDGQKMNYSREYLEFICAYRQIAERLPAYDAFVFHGAVVVRDDKAYVITAPSGTGKSTHVNLWRERFPDSWILNGDKPVFRKIEGRFCACGTAWQGKENWGCPEIRPIHGIGLLHRAAENTIAPVSGDALVTFAMQQIYLPKNPETLVKTLDLIDECFTTVPTYTLGCNMDPEAAEVVWRGMAGEKP